LDKEGRKHGLWVENYPNGHTKTEINYKNGQKNGLSLTYFNHPNCFKEEVSYRNDTLDGYYIEYYPNCKIRLVIGYKGGVRDGYERSYSRSGKLIAETYYVKGKQKGKTKTFNYAIDTFAGREAERALEEYLKGTRTFPDSIIFDALGKLSLTDRTVVVTDVTGSMYPYSGQLLLWFREKLGSTQLRQFVFFNDGNSKTSFQKKVGKTGGIYRTKASSLEDLKKTMSKALRKGDGGDLPENDIEALLKAQKKFRKPDQFILIADKTSAVRDIGLLPEVKKPVHVILCGQDSALNTQYLEIAYQTGGSVLVLHGEEYNVAALKENETVVIQGIRYQLRGRSFRRLAK
jgi:hypothetical protein